MRMGTIYGYDGETQEHVDLRGAMRDFHNQKIASAAGHQIQEFVLALRALSLSNHEPFNGPWFDGDFMRGFDDLAEALQ